MEYSFTNVWGQSWALYKKSWRMLTAGVVIYLIANIPSQAANIVQNLAAKGSPKPEVTAEAGSLLATLTCFAVIWSLFVVVPLALFGLLITVGLMANATALCCGLPLIFLGIPLALTQFGLAYNMLLNRDGIPIQPTSQPTNQPATPAV